MTRLLQCGPKVAGRIKCGFVAVAMVMSVVLVGCSHPEGWTVRGSLPSVKAGEKVAVEAFNPSQGVWYGVDSVEVGQDGQFTYTAATASPYPDIYRLSQGSQAIYFPIDSAETVTVAGASGSLTPSRVTGTPLAAQMMQVDSLIAVTPADADSVLKRRLADIILADNNGLISYYTITKSRNGKPLFDTSRRLDLSLVGAVANKFATERPDDPRTPLLRDVYLKNRAALPEIARQTREIQATSTGLFDIRLYDGRGVEHSLKDMASKGRVVVLSFTAYGAKQSPAYTAMLRKAWDTHHAGGLDIYEVSIDPEEGVWKHATERLPWTCVYNSPTQGDRNLLNYNVTEVPSTFIINRQGDLAEKVDDPNKLPSLLAKYM